MSLSNSCTYGPTFFFSPSFLFLLVCFSVFSDVDQQSSDVNSSASDAVPSTLLRTNSDASAAAGNSFMESDFGDEIPHEISELGTTKHGIGSSTDFGMGKLTLERDVIEPPETTARPLRLDGTEFISERKRSHAQRLSTESVGSDLSSVRATDLSNLNGDTDLPRGSGAPRNADTFLDSDFQLRRDLVVTLPSDERQKLNRVLVTFQQRLATAKTDMEDLIARLNQEAAVRQFLTTKVNYSYVGIGMSSSTIYKYMYIYIVYTLPNLVFNINNMFVINV